MALYSFFQPVTVTTSAHGTASATLTPGNVYVFQMCMVASVTSARVDTGDSLTVNSVSVMDVQGNVLMLMVLVLIARPTLVAETVKGKAQQMMK